MRALRIHEAASEEAAEAAAWYEAERPGLGADFERAVNAAFDILGKTSSRSPACPVSPPVAE
jgi:hypothetical protein